MSKIHEQYVEYVNWAIGITFSVVAFLLSKEEILELLQTDIIKGIFSIALLLITGMVFILYAKSVRHELDIMDYILDSEKIRVNDLSGNAFLFVILLSISFGFLIAFSTNILYYSVIVIIYTIIDLFGLGVVIRNLTTQFKRNVFRHVTAKKEADILFDYYIGHPLHTRVAMLLVLRCIAFVLSIYTLFTGNMLGDIIAYIIIILTFIVSESVIYFWRKSRDVALRELRDQKKEEVLATTK